MFRYRCEISTSVADRAMRSALSACLRKNLVSFTIVQPRQKGPARTRQVEGKFLLEGSVSIPRRHRNHNIGLA